MVFSSIIFLFYFLPLFLALYFLMPFKNTMLLVASLLFYAWGELGYVFLMLISIAANYLFGIGLSQLTHKKVRKWLLAIGVMVNLSLLAYYKYFNFAMAIFGVDLEEAVHLPLGISFFTFQAISYLVDVFRGDAKVEKNPLNLGLYIAMFPQLIAGPIVRFKTVAEQIHNRVFDLTAVNKGIRIFILGLGQKVLIANTVALPADHIFALSANELTTSLAWLGSLCYTFQIYFDFAAYSNMAIGLGLMMGFTFPQNFSHPYIAQSITEFWRRWHMSLSSWFRDYLYIPLGGNRVSPIRTYINLMVVFLLCGLWHGAAWTFIVWGLYHGLFLVIERLKLADLLMMIWRPLRHAYLLIVVIFGWVIFRAESFDHLVYFIETMFGFSEATSYQPFEIRRSVIVALIIATVLSMPVFNSLTNKIKNWQLSGLEFKARIFSVGLELFYLMVLFYSMLLIASGSYNPFIYFRF